MGAFRHDIRLAWPEARDVYQPVEKRFVGIVCARRLALSPRQTRLNRRIRGFFEGHKDFRQAVIAAR